MRLYMSSYGIGDRPDDLKRMVPDNAVVGVVCNACDSLTHEARIERVEREFGSLRALNFNPVEIDLRKYFGTKFAAEDLSNVDLIWVRGGNSFNLRRSMGKSCFDKVIVEALAMDVVAYGGYSAGVCVLAPTLRGIELCDPIDDIPDGYPSETDWSGLGVLPYSIAPHYKSNHPESAMIDDVVEYFDSHQMPYRTLSDGDVIIVDQR